MARFAQPGFCSRINTCDPVESSFSWGRNSRYREWDFAGSLDWHLADELRARVCERC